jgi:ABC-2 type transport system permease protein
LIHGDTGSLIAGTLAQLPAVWVLAAITVVLFGILPQFTPVAWGALGFCLLMLLVGETVQLNQWLLDVSPFTHIPHLPGGHPTATPLVVLAVLAIGLGGAGLAGFRRRDVPA